MLKLYRKKSGRGFSYFTDKHFKVKHTDKADLKWVKSLAIPPAWENVEIKVSTRAKIYAWGRDSKQRKQYIYNPGWLERRRQQRFNRILKFGTRLPGLRAVTSEHLKSEDLDKNKVLACMCRLIDTAYFRPGNSSYTKENETYGLTTLRSKHLQLDGDQIIFHYKGKHSKDQEKVVTDHTLATVIAELDELPGYEIFKYVDDQGRRHKLDSSDLNTYIREHMGEDYSAKDFRTWAGTVLAAVALEELKLDPDKTPDKTIIKAVRKVAAALGNTESVARANYIDPRVLSNYLDGKTIGYFKKEIRKKLQTNSSAEELLVLKMIEQSL